jgi:hypothetical protein
MAKKYGAKKRPIRHENRFLTKINFAIDFFYPHILYYRYGMTSLEAGLRLLGEHFLGGCLLWCWRLWGCWQQYYVFCPRRVAMTRSATARLPLALT